MEVQPATLTQILKDRQGRRVEVPDDAGNVAQDLCDLDPDLRLFFNEFSGAFTVVKVMPDQTEHFVLSAMECDQRIISTMRRIMAQDYSLADEIEALEDRHEREFEQRQFQKIGDVGERLSHAIRKDYGDAPLISIPKSVK